MTALGVVREVETGSIANFRSTPLTSLEFLLGKQVPYLVIGLISFATLIALALFVFAVPVKGSWLALVGRAVLYLGAATQSSDRPSPAHRWPRYLPRRSSR